MSEEGHCALFKNSRPYLANGLCDFALKLKGKINFLDTVTLFREDQKPCMVVPCSKMPF